MFFVSLLCLTVAPSCYKIDVKSCFAITIQNTQNTQFKYYINTLISKLCSQFKLKCSEANTCHKSLSMLPWWKKKIVCCGKITDVTEHGVTVSFKSCNREVKTGKMAVHALFNYHKWGRSDPRFLHMDYFNAVVMFMPTYVGSDFILIFQCKSSGRRSCVRMDPYRQENQYALISPRCIRFKNTHL